MKADHERVWENCFRKGAFLGILVLFLIIWTGRGEDACAGVFSAQAVHAASQDAPTAERIDFTDKSGKYLKYKNGKFYLYNKRGVRLGGPQYLRIPAVHGIFSGYYMSSEKGVLQQKKAVYRIEKKKAGSRLFNGYYFTSAIGRFIKSEKGLQYFPDYRCGKLHFKGYFYVGEYGRLSGTAGIRYLKAAKVNGKKFTAGYYFFNKYGRLYSGSGFHSFKGLVNGLSFNGTYFFGGSNGSLYGKTGWITYKKVKYYITSNGRRVENAWKDGYYLLSDGTIARSMRVPDGSYVDCDGRKCKKEDMALSGLKKELQQMISAYPGTWSVYVKDLKTGDVVNINDRSMYPASTIKLFAMASVFDQISQKKMTYSTSVKSLLNSMITVSDNESFNQLVRLQSSDRSFLSGAAVMNQYLKKNGYTSTECHNTLHPASSSYVGDGGSNSSSARDCGLILERIYKGKCVSRAYSKEMLNLLLKQTRRWKIPAGLPAGTKVANKTGETASYQHDAAIVYGPKTTYVLCVFSQTTEYNGINGIKKITAKVHSYLN